MSWKQKLLLGKKKKKAISSCWRHLQFHWGEENERKAKVGGNFHITGPRNSINNRWGRHAIDTENIKPAAVESNWSN